MKLNNIKKTAICMSFLAAVGCTGNFDEINTNPNGFSNDQLKDDFNDIKKGFAPMFNNIQVLGDQLESQYQLQQNLNADIWSGYMATPTPFRGGSNNTTYDLIDGWNNAIWTNAYPTVMFNAYDIANKTKGKFDHFYALSLILKVEGMHRVTDIFGPIIYSQYGKNAPIAYDSQEEVYNQMFSELDFAVDELTKRADAGEPFVFKDADLSGYEGNYASWVKFANTLRLRLAMRIVKVKPALAKAQAEKAVAQKFGVFTAKKDAFRIVSPTFTNPIATISGSWLDIRMSADMESILKGYNDPRMPIYFDKSAQFTGQYKGIRTGIAIGGKGDRERFSGIGEVVRSKTIYLVTTAEAYFLRAEGALRGWNMGGDAKSLYEAGIQASFDQREASGIAKYLTDNTSLPVAYVDPVAAVNNSAPVNNITIAWDDAATNEVKLQRIITQKWIAGFPEGQEAWSDYRRTGYPKLFPVVVNNSGGKISTALGARRINFTSNEVLNNKEGVATGVAKLGGPDNGGTRLWWDVNAPNF
ncbi:RagB/SusD family nutrient uptake outer membrane protein [Flavobacterium tructae]|uniref:SusD/RagB family nutrient-binding outer membrane lipoprotein n=1 Tax=Flavobacterium tructae TaxID=1114873 RepID=A0A1S1IXU9_9FLAO|nr:RagB/SusD family nutrient uptake outer membrane protein [Flavobacterium tructae]OHT43192.1 hypothetical protein BHE19_19680 [Flavobacterium tructae]OXB20442.1 hypothetical protein B0A71_07440 [Flavobacterium tructae]OXB23946.1 hypothetical protein B0A80_08230 [Flavobacterium tructae]